MCFSSCFNFFARKAFVSTTLRDLAQDLLLLGCPSRSSPRRFPRGQAVTFTPSGYSHPMLPLVDYRDSQEHLNAIEKFTMICAEQTTYIFKLCPPAQE